MNRRQFPARFLSQAADPYIATEQMMLSIIKQRLDSRLYSRGVWEKLLRSSYLRSEIKTLSLNIFLKKLPNNS